VVTIHRVLVFYLLLTRRVSVYIGRDSRWRIHGCERIATTKRRTAHCGDLQYGSWSSGSSNTLHNSSSS